MKLIFFIDINNNILSSLFFILMLVIVSKGSYVNAQGLTYSPDQWPRHWNQLINKKHQQEYMNDDRSYNKNINRERPQRSPIWGMVPLVKQKPRRTSTPEYDTQSHMRSHYNHDRYRENLYSGNHFSGMSYGLASPFNHSYIVPGLAPGLAAPGIPMTMHPYSNNPYIGASPYMTGYPGMGPMLW